MTRWIETAHQQIQESITVPMWQRGEDQRINKWDDLSRFPEHTQGLILLFIPTEYSERWLVDCSDAQRSALLAGVALERYWRDHRRWPMTLSQLVPEYLREVPTDPFTGKPAFYKVIDGEPRIYSVGSDRDDDGGRYPPAPTMGQHVNSYVQSWKVVYEAPVDADWVLYPSRPTIREAGKTAMLPEDLEALHPYNGMPFDGGYDPYGRYGEKADTPDESP